MFHKNLKYLLLVVILLLASGQASAQVNLKNTTESQPNLPSGIDWSYDSDQVGETTPYDHSALWVGDKCDVNNDGYDDLIVGKRDYNQSTVVDNGIAWLFLGSENGLPTSPSLTFNPPYSNTYGFFGSQAKCAGDVNGDDYDDIIIGMDNYDNGNSDEGAVYLYYGGETPDATHDWMAESNTTWAHFGGTVDSAGNINNDEYDDIIVGANANDLGTLNAAYVWFGSENGPAGGTNGSPTNADWKATDTTNTMAFALVVRGIGDVNGDDYDDVLVSAHMYDDASYFNQGAVFVYYGSSSGLGANGTTANADWMAKGQQTDAFFGRGVDGIGDVNGDGVDDLAVGAYGYDDSENAEGKVFVWYGEENVGLGDNGTPSNADWEAESNDNGAILGYSVSPAGDVNNDGYADLLASAAGYTTGGAYGAYFVWTGSASGLGEDGTPQNADQSGYGDQSGSNFGRENVSALDVDGDGGDDIFVAAMDYTNGQNYEGMVFGYYANLGELKITKQFDPLTSGFAGTFAINYDCDDGTEHDGTVNLLAGETQTISGIPVGTQCTVTEPSTPTPPTGWSFGSPTFNPSSGVVTVDEKSPAYVEVTVTNTISRAMGELKITKQFDPFSSGFVGSFGINYNCDDGTEHDGTVNLLAGESQTITGIPIGTQCTVTEPTAPTPPTGWSFGSPTFNPLLGVVTVSEKSPAFVEVVVTNTIMGELYLPIAIR